MLAVFQHRQTLCIWFSKDYQDSLSLKEGKFFVLTSDELFILQWKEYFVIFVSRGFQSLHRD